MKPETEQCFEDETWTKLNSLASRRQGEQSENNQRLSLIHQRLQIFSRRELCLSFCVFIWVSLKGIYSDETSQFLRQIRILILRCLIKY